MTLINDEFVKEDSKKIYTLQIHSFSCQKL